MELNKEFSKEKNYLMTKMFTVESRNGDRPS